jgi:hypothetical protein
VGDDDEMLAQSLPLAHELPWYFGLALFVVWALSVCALIWLISLRVKARRANRRRRRQRQLHRGYGTEVELYDDVE